MKELARKGRIERLKRSIFSQPGKDIPAGIVVFLVALPLCLGIALASGAPLVSGLISGIIGGIVVGLVSQSHVSVSGPAASVSAVVLVALQKLPTFEVFLLALVIGGLIQLVLGMVKAGIIADYLPTSIIKGLLAAIGLILIISQLPFALGMEQDTKFIDYSRNFIRNGYNFSSLLNLISPGAIILSIVSLAIIIFWDQTPLRKIKLLPPFLVVVIIGAILNQGFRYLAPSLYLGGIHLVNIPEIEGWSSFLHFPDFSYIGDVQVWTYAVTIALIASIASLLAVEAADNLDPHKRRSPPNRELVAQGVGNTLAGLIGGIPLTTVIVRSSVNIQAGAESKLSTIVHGVLLLLSVLLLSPIINLIPLASLAVLLLVVGYKLASIAIFKQMYSKGWDQFVPFVVTTLGILFTDVLIGVLIGTASSLFFLLRGNFSNPFHIEKQKGKVTRLELSNEVSFLNKPAIKRTLWNLRKNSRIIIDATFTTYIERDVIDILNDFQNTYARENNISVIITGLRESFDPEGQLNLAKGPEEVKKALSTPEDILYYLMAGNQRYVDGSLVSRRLRNKELMDFIKEAPLATVVNSVDMREPLNMMLNTDIGDLIPLRAAGNLVGTDIIRSIEIACRKQGARLILLMGNSGNTSVKEALEHYRSGKESYLHHMIGPAIGSGEFSDEKLMSEDVWLLANEIIKWNLEESELRIIRESPYLQEEINANRIGLCSGFLYRKTGEIEFSGLFEPSRNPYDNLPDPDPERNWK